MKMFKFVNQVSSTFGVSLVSAAYSRTQRLWHRFAPRLMGHGSREVPRSWYATPAVQLRSLQGHISCKGQSLSFVGVTETASLHRISTTFISNASYFGSAQSFWGTRYHNRKLSLSSYICQESREGIAEKDLKREIDDLTDKFMETRELLEDAIEAKGTVYFNDDLKDAKESVQETLSQYEDLMTKLSEEQERNVRRTIGLKMEELRAQEAMIDESLKD